MPRSGSAKAKVRASRVKVGDKDRARKIARSLAKAYPEAVCALSHDNPFQLLAATILSAQCTDARVNAVTPQLFKTFPTPEKLARATQSEVEDIIRSLGFFRAKAKSLRGMATKLTDEFHGEMPRTIEELITLPGVGRKTANVLLGTAFGIATGVVVDTHVRRLSRRLGLTKHTDPARIERDLMELLPSTEWVNFSHRLIHHGRRICAARKPKCPECPLLSLCPRVGLPPLDQ